MSDFVLLRKEMLDRQIKPRGVRDKRLLEAMGRIRRELFVPADMQHAAYQDNTLRVADGQAMPQPYIVAYMIEALELQGSEKVLEIGAGTGYTAAILGEMVSEVYTLESIGQLASKAASNLIDQGYGNIHIQHSDDPQGWSEYAPFDAILVSTAVSSVSDELISQLAIGGRMIATLEINDQAQELVLITRDQQDQIKQTALAEIKIVPVTADELTRPRVIPASKATSDALSDLISSNCEAFNDSELVNLDALLARIGDRRVVLIGEASHGTSEFYQVRERITRRLIEEKGFTFVAAEADWPDAARIDHYVRHRDVSPSTWEAFSRFPTWMWRNEEVRSFIDWLHAFNQTRNYEQRTGFYGLDLYSLYNSAGAVIDYLNDVDPDLAMVAKSRYGCLTPWEADPAAYGHAALTGAYRNCEPDVVKMLLDVHAGHQAYAYRDGERFLDAEQNASLVVNAERYYRVMYYGSRESWNLRDGHMFDTLQKLLQFHGEQSKAVVWAHNSHIGDAAATEMSARGEHNIGELCRKAFGDQSYRIGFGTDHGTVAAASAWDGPMEIKQVQPSHPQSYESVFHRTTLPGLLLPLSAAGDPDLLAELSNPRLERAIGVIYRPESELASHYFEAELTRQFNEYIWLDKTSAVTQLPSERIAGMPDTYPFGI